MSQAWEFTHLGPYLIKKLHLLVQDYSRTRIQVSFNPLTL